MYPLQAFMDAAAHAGITARSSVIQKLRAVGDLLRKRMAEGVVTRRLGRAEKLGCREALERLRTDGAPGAAFALAPMRGVREQIDPRARWLGWVLATVIRGIDRRYGFRAIAWNAR